MAKKKDKESKDDQAERLKKDREEREYLPPEEAAENFDKVIKSLFGDGNKSGD